MRQQREQHAAGLAAALLEDGAGREDSEQSQVRTPADDSTLALRVRNIDFSYGPVQVLFDVSIDVPKSQVLALLGTNGAGKSTVLRVVSGLGRPSRGQVHLNGRDITNLDTMARVRAGIVQVSGGNAAFPTLSVYENLLVGAHTFIWDTERVAAKCDEVLALFPALEPRLGSLAGMLSGGERQMLAIAKALMLEPEILIIDELSLGLAPVIVQDLLRIVEGLKARGMTIILVEQSINIALSVAERAIFMEKGRVRFEGAGADLIGRDDLVRAVFLGAGAKPRRR